MDLILHSDLVIENNILKEDLIIEGNWRYTQELMHRYALNKELYITQDLYLRRIVKEPRYKTLKDLLPRVGQNKEASYRNINVANLFEDGWGSNEDGAEELRVIMNHKGVIEFPKPRKLIEKLIASIRDKNATTLDFFSGSCTTAHAVLDLNKEDSGNRKFICVQLPEKCDEKSEAFKAGYKTIADIGKERIRRVIKKIKEDGEGKLPFEKTKRDLGFKVFKLRQSNFKIWQPKIKNEEELFEQLTFHTNPVDENAKIENILYELLLKSGIPLTAKIENKGGYYLVNDGEIALMLEKVDEEIIKAITAERPGKVIALDRLFKDNDQLKTNTALQMKDAAIEFKAV
jgi:adenine-specific DNA-methyltransferase